MAAATKIKNAESLTHAIAHHAQPLEPLVGCLALEFLTRLQPLGWRVEQSGRGSQSFSIKRDGTEFHLRGLKEQGPKYSAILVKDAYHRGNEVAVLRTRSDVLRFVRDISES